MAGGDIVMGSVTRHHAGTYQCVTRDEYGLEPVTKEVDLFVECKSYQLVLTKRQGPGCTGYQSWFNALKIFIWCWLGVSQLVL